MTQNGNDAGKNVAKNTAVTRDVWWVDKQHDASTKIWRVLSSDNTYVRRSAPRTFLKDFDVIYSISSIFRLQVRTQPPALRLTLFCPDAYVYPTSFCPSSFCPTSFCSAPILLNLNCILLFFCIFMSCWIIVLSCCILLSSRASGVKVLLTFVCLLYTCLKTMVLLNSEV